VVRNPARYTNEINKLVHQAEVAYRFLGRQFCQFCIPKNLLDGGYGLGGLSAWEADVLPLNYARVRFISSIQHRYL